MKTYGEIVAYNIRRLLRERDMTQNELAKKIGVTPMAVTNWCNNVNTPRNDKIDKICEMLLCTLVYISVHFSRSTTKFQGKEQSKSGTTSGTTFCHSFAITPLYSLGLIMLNVVINSSITVKTSFMSILAIF